MYLSQFGFSRRPFSATPDSNCVVPVGGMPEALAELEHCVQNGQGLGILTAPAGLGKTVLCRKLAEQLREQFAVVFLPNANFPTRRSLLQAILYEMGHPYLRLGEQELRLELTTAVRGLTPDRDGLVVIVDEAHLLHNRLLEELRIATHLVQNGEMLVRVVLSGQLDLEERLVRKELAAINQRIVCQSSLCSFTQSESRDYLQHRVEWAGGDLNAAFNADAIAMICSASDGNPRCLNQLADHALLLASADNVTTVTAEHVADSLEELKQLPLHWNTAAIPKANPPKPTAVEFITDHPEQQDCDEETAGETTCIEFGAPTDESVEMESLEDATETALEIEMTDEDASVWEVGAETVASEVTAADESAEEIDPVMDAVEAKATAEELAEALKIVAVEFQEEVINDKYAQLDDGREVENTTTVTSETSVDPVAELRHEEDCFPVPPPSSRMPELTVINALKDASEEWQPEDLTAQVRKPAADPSEMIDSVLPLIDAALEDTAETPVSESIFTEDSEDSPSELKHDSGLDDSWVFDCNDVHKDGDSFIVINEPLPKELAEDTQPYVMMPPSELSENPEQEIAKLILDTHEDLQSLMWSTDTETPIDETPNPTAGESAVEKIRDPGDATPFEELQQTLRAAIDAIPDETGDTIHEAAQPKAEKTTAYDVIMPESDDAEASQSGQRQYRNLFSKIRRSKPA